jgi:hypothetical protein
MRTQHRHELTIVGNESLKSLLKSAASGVEVALQNILQVGVHLVRPSHKQLADLRDEVLSLLTQALRVDLTTRAMQRHDPDAQGSHGVVLTNTVVVEGREGLHDLAVTDPETKFKFPGNEGERASSGGGLDRSHGEPPAPSTAPLVPE